MPSTTMVDLPTPDSFNLSMEASPRDAVGERTCVYPIVLNWK